MALSGDYAFAGSGTVLLVVDSSVPGTPDIVAEVVLTDMVTAVAAAGDHA